MSEPTPIEVPAGWQGALRCFAEGLRENRSAFAWLGEAWMMLTIFPIAGLLVLLGSLALLLVHLVKLPLSAIRWLANDLKRPVKA